MQLRLFATSGTVDDIEAEAWLVHLLSFLDEDKALVESAQRGYVDNFNPGPAHQLEQRILHWQAPTSISCRLRAWSGWSATRTPFRH